MIFYGYYVSFHKINYYWICIFIKKCDIRCSIFVYRHLYDCDKHDKNIISIWTIIQTSVTHL
jgi:hypothetical protein